MQSHQAMWLPSILPSLRKPAHCCTYALILIWKLRPKTTHSNQASSLCKNSISTRPSLHSSVFIHSAFYPQPVPKSSSCLRPWVSLRDPGLNRKTKILKIHPGGHLYTSMCPCLAYLYTSQGMSQHFLGKDLGSLCWIVIRHLTGTPRRGST